VPGTPKKVNARKMWKVSGFSWKNVGYKTTNVEMNVRLDSKRPMFQLAETFGMTDAALTTNAPEYQSAYTGSTYDGNDVNLNAIQTDADPVSLPDAAFAGSQITDVGGLGEIANDCTESHGVEGTKMSNDAAAIDAIAKGLGSAPICHDHGAVDAWNAKVQQMNALCQDFNVQQTVLSNKCQTSNTPMPCEQYQKDTTQGGMIISKCQKPNQWIDWLIMLLIFLIVIAIAVFLGPLAAFIAAMLAYMLYSEFGGAFGGAGSLNYQDVTLTEGDAKPGFKNTKTIGK